MPDDTIKHLLQYEKVYKPIPTLLLTCHFNNTDYLDLPLLAYPLSKA